MIEMYHLTVLVATSLESRCLPAGPCSLWGLCGKILACFFQLRMFTGAAWCALAYRNITPIKWCSSPSVSSQHLSHVPVCVCVQISPFPKNTSHIRLWPKLMNLITSVKILSPNKVTSRATGDVSFGGRQNLTHNNCLLIQGFSSLKYSRPYLNVKHCQKYRLEI